MTLAALCSLAFRLPILVPSSVDLKSKEETERTKCAAWSHKLLRSLYSGFISFLIEDGKRRAPSEASIIYRYENDLQLSEELDEKGTLVHLSGKGPLNELMLIFTVHKLLMIAKVEIASLQKFPFIESCGLPSQEYSSLDLHLTEIFGINSIYIVSHDNSRVAMRPIMRTSNSTPFPTLSHLMLCRPFQNRPMDHMFYLHVLHDVFKFTIPEYPTLPVIGLEHWLDEGGALTTFNVGTPYLGTRMGGALSHLGVLGNGFKICYHNIAPSVVYASRPETKIAGQVESEGMDGGNHNSAKLL
ncbi:hypothetical protein DFH27DRAFT_100926 [Peziza echinospora]|nr:hypothetical protein DFH27DRAFT_100926 [Peziza echinospora]